MMKNIPVYKHTAAYAREHDELAAYRASNQVNVACKEAIEAAIRDHYRDNRLDTAAVDQVVQQFGYDRRACHSRLREVQREEVRLHAKAQRCLMMSQPSNEEVSREYPLHQKRRCFPF